MQYIGKLDKEKLGKYKNKITTDKVVLTEERKRHIYEHHNKDYEKIINNISKTILKPKSVMRAWIIRDSNLKKMYKKYKIIYKKE